MLYWYIDHISVNYVSFAGHIFTPVNFTLETHYDEIDNEALLIRQVEEEVQGVLFDVVICLINDVYNKDHVAKRNVWLFSSLYLVTNI